MAAHPANTVANRRHVAAIGCHPGHATGAQPSQRPMTMRAAPGAVVVRPAADNQTATDADTTRKGRPGRGQLPRMNGEATSRRLWRRRRRERQLRQPVGWAPATPHLVGVRVCVRRLCRRRRIDGSHLSEVDLLGVQEGSHLHVERLHVVHGHGRCRSGRGCAGSMMGASAPTGKGQVHTGPRGGSSRQRSQRSWIQPAGHAGHTASRYTQVGTRHGRDAGSLPRRRR